MVTLTLATFALTMQRPWKSDLGLMACVCHWAKAPEQRASKSIATRNEYFMAVLVRVLADKIQADLPLGDLLGFTALSDQCTSVDVREDDSIRTTPISHQLARLRNRRDIQCRAHFVANVGLLPLTRREH